jgi:uncharacterized protein GlcG (DUF336 family)
MTRAVVSDDVAKRTLMKMQINAATARALVDACVAFARASNASYSIFVLAPTGEVVDAHIMDGQFPIAVEAAELKAKTVLYACSSSRAVTQQFSTTEGRLPRLRLGESGGLAYYFAPGGLPIVVEDQLIGAIGVGGGAQEEQSAHHALTSTEARRRRPASCSSYRKEIVISPFGISIRDVVTNASPSQRKLDTIRCPRAFPTTSRASDSSSYFVSNGFPSSTIVI